MNFNKARQMAEDAVAKNWDQQRLKIHVAAVEGEHSRQDARMFQDYMKEVSRKDDLAIAKSEFVSRHLDDDASVSILSTMFFREDEDGIISVDDLGNIFQGIETRKDWDRRWTDMISSGLVEGDGSGNVIVQMAKLVEYVRTAGLRNDWG